MIIHTYPMLRIIKYTQTMQRYTFQVVERKITIISFVTIRLRQSHPGQTSIIRTQSILNHLLGYDKYIRMIQKGMHLMFIILQSYIDLYFLLCYGHDINFSHFSIIKALVLGIMTYQVLDIPGLITIKEIITYTKNETKVSLLRHGFIVLVTSC